MQRRVKEFACDGCDRREIVASDYRKKAPSGWMFRETVTGLVVSCSADCTEKIDQKYRPAWLRVPASDAG